MRHCPCCGRPLDEEEYKKALKRHVERMILGEVREKLQDPAQFKAILERLGTVELEVRRCLGCGLVYVYRKLESGLEIGKRCPNCLSGVYSEER